MVLGKTSTLRTPDTIYCIAIFYIQYYYNIILSNIAIFDIQYYYNIILSNIAIFDIPFPARPLLTPSRIACRVNSRGPSTVLPSSVGPHDALIIDG